MNVATAAARRGATSCAFDVARRVTVPADGAAHRVTVAVVRDVAATLEYHVRPRRAGAAFVRAVCANPCAFCLLDGPCRVFVEGAFVATAALEYTAPGEPFALFLGPDRDLAVAYQTPAALADRAGLVIRSNVDRFEGEIRITNNKDVPVKLVVQDQLPKADSAEITVSLLEPAISPQNPVCVFSRSLFSCSCSCLLLVVSLVCSCALCWLFRAWRLASATSSRGPRHLQQGRPLSSPSSSPSSTPRTES